MMSPIRFSTNPILIKELRSRMRGWRAFVLLTLSLLLLAGISFLIYKIMLMDGMYMGNPLSPQIGQAVFVALSMLELLVICGVTPAVVGGAISSEKERLTYEMLMSTPLSPVRVLWGKLISALSYVFLLLFAAIPMASLVFIFGGVSLRDMIKAMIVLVVITVMLGVVGLFFSTLLNRTSRAIILSYVFMAALFIIPAAVYISIGVFSQDMPPRWVMIPSPGTVLLSATSITQEINGGFLMAVFGAISPISHDSIPRPMYHYSIPVYLGITVILYGLSSILIQPVRQWRIYRKSVLICLGVLLLIVAFTVSGFLVTRDRYEEYMVETAGDAPVMAVGALSSSIMPGPVVGFTNEVVVAVEEEPDAYLAVVNGGEIAQDELVDMYSQIILDAINSMGVTDNRVDYLYLVGEASEQPDRYLVEEVSGVDFSEGTKQLVAKAVIDDMRIGISWIAYQEAEVVDQQIGVDPNNRVIIAPGTVNLSEGEAATAEISLAVYSPDALHVAYTYTLEETGDGWQVLQRTEVE